MTNLTSGGSVEHIVHAVQAGCLKPLCNLLTVQDAKIIHVILEAINNILLVSTMLKDTQIAAGPNSQRSKIDRNCKSIVVAKYNVMSQYNTCYGDTEHFSCTHSNCHYALCFCCGALRLGKPTVSLYKTCLYLWFSWYMHIESVNPSCIVWEVPGREQRGKTIFQKSFPFFNSHILWLKVSIKYLFTLLPWTISNPTSISTHFNFQSLVLCNFLFCQANQEFL